MAAGVISTVLRFVRKHISSLCCLLLLLLPPVHRVLLFFSPLLVSTALCVLALISWGPSSDGQNKSDKNTKMDDQWAVVRCELECNEACSNADNLEEISRSQELAEEQPDNPRERLQEGETLATSVKPAEARTSEPDPDLKNHDDEGSVEEGSVGVHPSVELSRYLRQAPLQKRSEEEKSVIPANGCDKRILQGVDAKLHKAVEKELAGLEASLWSYEGAMKERLGSLGDAGMEDGAPKHHFQSKSLVRKEKVLHEQRKADLHTYEPSGLREVASKA